MSESEGVVDRGGLSDPRGESGVEDSGSIPLNIRSPAASFQDIRLDCPGVWTITMLKQKISQTLNFKVSPKKQRLVYAGKILEDEDQLNNVIRFQDECSVYTILLVSSQPPQKVIKPKDNSESSRMLMPESSTNIPPVPSNPVTTAGTNLELNSWASEYLQLSNQIQERGESSEQMVAIQEMYSQYLMQYIQYLQTASPQYMQTQPTQYFQGLQTDNRSWNSADLGSATTGLRHRHPAQPGNPAPEHQAVGDLNGAGGVNAPDEGVNAPGGVGVGAAPAQGAPLANRDTLDWVYSCVRVLFLVSLVYFYSSLPRFLLVLGIFLAFHYFQREGHHQERLNIQQQVNNIRDNNNQGNNNTTPEEERTPDTEEIEQGQEALNVQANVPPPDTLTTVSTFIMSFFTSLLPEPPQQLVD